MQPLMGLHDSGLVISTSSAIAGAMLDANTPPAALDEPGNVYVRVHPREATAAVAKAGEVLAEAHLLKGYTLESFKKTAAQWQADISEVEEVTGMAACDGGEVVVTVKMVCAGDGLHDTD